MHEPQVEAWKDRLRRFEIGRTLGSGGMGVVYEAIDRERNLRVALKTLPKIEPQALYRFKQEFRLLAGLSHPNLATLYELIATDDHWCLTMELVEGSDLLTYVRQGITEGFTPFSPPTPDDPDAETTAAPDPLAIELAAPALSGRATGPALRDMSRLTTVLRQLASALMTLHSHRRLHCDIKPSNVLVTPAGRVVVLDFGLAADLSRGRGAPLPGEMIYGTVAYMAPEQLAGEPLTPACDWYAVGSMLYEALSGRRPFGGSPQEMLAAKLRQLPPPPLEASPWVPAGLSALCLRLMAPSPAERADGQDLLATIGGTAVPSVDATPSDHVDLVGRERQLAVLNRAFADAIAGGAVCVFMHAPSGAGKTALLEHASGRFAAEHDALVVTGRCYEQESVQFKALDSLIDGLSRHLAALPPEELKRVLPPDVVLLARMFPVIGRLTAAASTALDEGEVTSPQELRERTTATLRRLLQALSGTRPLVLAIDDLQWGDVDSVALILGVLAPPSPPPLLLLCAFRREYAESAPCLRALLGAAPEAFARVDLPIDPLEAPAAERLAARLLGEESALSPSLAARVAQESGGNPYFVQALVEDMRGDPHFWITDVPADTISLDEVLRRRLARLRPSARRLLEAIALAGRPLAEADAYAAADLDIRDPGLLSALRNAHLIRSGGIDHTLETYHDRIRESVVEQLPATSLQHLHGRLATTLELRASIDPEWLGAHFQGAGELATAARYYSQAADVAAGTLAFDRAAELYRRSLELGAGSQPTQQALRIHLADALANGGRAVQAGEVYQLAARSAEGTDALELERKAGYQFCIGGSMRTGRTVLGANLKRVGITLPRSARAAISSLLLNRARLRWRAISGRLTPRPAGANAGREVLERLDLLWATAAALSDVDTVVAASLQSRHLIEAIRAGEPGRIAAALALQVITSAHEGYRARARTVWLAEAAQRFADSVNTPYAKAMTLLGQSVWALYQHQWLEAAAALDQAEELLRRHCTGVLWELSLLHSTRVSVLRVRGEYGEMFRVAAAVLAEAAQRGDVFTQARVGVMIGPDTAVRNDDPSAARTTVRRMRAEWLRRDFPTQRMMSCFAELEVDFYTGRGRAAHRRISRYWPILERSQFLRSELVRMVAYSVRAGAALAALDHASADRLALLDAAERDAERLGRERGKRALVFEEATRAAIAWRRGDRRRTIDLLTATAARCEREGLQAYYAAARYYLGRIIGGLDGERLVEEAQAWFLSQGMRNPARTAAVHLMGFPPSLDDHSDAGTTGDRRHAHSQPA